MTTIPAVLNALVALYASVTDAQVILGPAGATTVKSSHVIAVGPVRGTEGLDSLGLGTSNHSYDVEVIVSVALSAGTVADAVLAADTLWSACESAVRHHPTGDLGVPGVLQAIPTGDFELTEYAEETTRSAAYKSTIRIQAQLT